jgi:hypothetical protein
MNLEPYETSLTRMDSLAVNWAYSRQLLKQAISGKPNITLVEEIDTTIIILILKVKSTKNASKLYYTYPPQDPAIRYLAGLLRRKRIRESMQNFNRNVVAGNTTSLKLYTPPLETQQDPEI